jgi:hypothetical protein
MSKDSGLDSLQRVLDKALGAGATEKLFPWVYGKKATPPKEEVPKEPEVVTHREPYFPGCTPHEPSIYDTSGNGSLNPAWVEWYMAEYKCGHRDAVVYGAVTAEQLLKGIIPPHPKMYRGLGPATPPDLTNRKGQVTMRWVVYFKTNFKTDLNYAEITVEGYKLYEELSKQ